jgi:hypothetical protein
MKVDWKWPNVVLFSVVASVLGALVYANKIPPATLGALLAWLIPSPLKSDNEVKP